MNCHLKLSQLKEAIVWVLIQQGCQRSMGSPHPLCILLVVQWIHTLLPPRTQDHANLHIQGSFSHPCILVEILMAMDAILFWDFTQQLMHKNAGMNNILIIWIYFISISNIIAEALQDLKLWIWYDGELLFFYGKMMLRCIILYAYGLPI